MCVSVCGFSQKNDSQFIQDNGLVPAGTVHISEDLYMDISEISNLAILEFHYYMRLDSVGSYATSIMQREKLDWAIPKEIIVLDDNGDSITDQFNCESKQTIDYFENPTYRFFPAVGISYDQAIAYCQWRSEVVSLKMNIKLEKSQVDFRVKYTYFLPTPEEWFLAVDDTISVGSVNKKLKSKLKRIGHNEINEIRKASIRQNIFRSSKKQNVLVSGINFVGSTPSNGLNTKGLYNTWGNVAEMTAQEGVAVGGSWAEPLSDVMNDAIQYTKPESWLGFRCTAKVEIIKLVD